MKEKFNEKWWYYLDYLFKEQWMMETLSKIQNDEKVRKLEVVPSSNNIFQRFKLINPDDVRVVFLTEEPICSFVQSGFWRILSCKIEHEISNDLWLNLENNLDYMIPQGIIGLSDSLTINNKLEMYNWHNFVIRVIHTLMNTGNKILYISDENILTDYVKYHNPNTYKYEVLNYNEMNIKDINNFMKKEYNTKLNWI